MAPASGSAPAAKVTSTTSKPAHPKPHPGKPTADPAKSLDQQADFARQQMRLILRQMRGKSGEAANPINWVRRYPIGGLVTAAVAGVAGFVAVKVAHQSQANAPEDSHEPLTGERSQSAGQSCEGRESSCSQEEPTAGNETNHKAQVGSSSDSPFQKLSRRLLRVAYKHGLQMARAVAADFLARSVKGPVASSSDQPADKGVKGNAESDPANPAPSNISSSHG